MALQEITQAAALPSDNRSAQPIRPGEAPQDRLIRLCEVLQIVGIGKSTWYELISKGEAPASVSITPRAVAWSQQAVFKWVQDRINQAGAGGTSNTGTCQ